jgi:peptide/nickel transport system substrate-binding protein
VGAGLAGGALASILAACQAASPPPLASTVAPQPAEPTIAAPGRATVTGRGTSGTLKILMPAAPTILNPHLAQGNKDQVASRLCCEPLLTVSGDGALSPVLAAEVPSKGNGGVSADGRVVTYKLKKDVRWADGQPFSADDVVFTYQYVTNKATAAASLGVYLDLDQVEAVDPVTVRLTFKQPAGGWYVPFTGTFGMIVPRHALQNHVGAEARNAPFNLKAFGAGPFMVQDFKPGDSLIVTANPNYREPTRPFFNQVQIKGGGDAASAVRAVLQTGEYDYAVSVGGIEAQVLAQLRLGNRGDLIIRPGAVEQIFFNMADPNTEINSERSSPQSRHPFLTDQRVREAMSLAIDRAGMAKQLFGETGEAAVTS